ncbi:MAG: lysophospholipid acyltransferase family protein, partial [Gammaproteobacteria bacterium]
MQITYQLGVVIALALLLGWLWRWFWRVCEAANQADWGGRWLNRLDGLNRLFCRHYHRLHYTPIRLPDQGCALVASNHVSGLDPLLLIAAARRPLRFVIAREEYQRFGLTWLFRAIGCIPVERERQPGQALRQALRALERGEVVVLFPHGKIHLDSDPPRKLKG